MDERRNVFHQALVSLLVEAFDGPPGEMAFMLNPGDPGLLRQLESVSAGVASTRPMPGKTTIASHVDHVLYGIELMNRWADGEPDPFSTADWSASWRRTSVDDAEWRTLIDRLRVASTKWRQHVADRTEWDVVGATGATASMAHAMYHLGAIRQLLAAAGAA